MSVARAFGAASLVLFAACGGHKDAPPPPTGSGYAPVVARAADASVADSGASAVEVVEAQAYKLAMKRGRLHTDKQRYSEAIAAFDAALAKKKGDPRALAERGYAHLLAGDLDKASNDFDTAAKTTKDAKLLSQIWFNRGLVDERLKQPDNAQVDFYLANTLAPSKAAQSKLAGKSVCPVHVDTGFDRGPVLEGADWKALAKQMELDAPVPDAPDIVISGSAGSGRTAYLVTRSGQKLRAFPVGADVGGRCPGSVAFDVVRTVGDRIHVHGSELPEGGYDISCMSKTGDFVDCDSPDSTGQGRSFCAGGTPSELDLVIDVAQGKTVIAVERPELDEKFTSGGRVTARMVATGLELKGLDCDRVVPF